MAEETKRPLKVFLCHASSDKPAVRDLYKRLLVEGVDAWLDQEKLLPGQDWRVEIPRAVREADVVVICLSNKSITKEGYVQKEIKFALDSADEKPQDTIFLIPARLEDCVVPEQLGRWQWVDLFEENGFVRLLRSLKLRANRIGATIEPAGYESEDKETEHRLDQLYTEGLAAFYTEDWDRASQRFQAILRERPNHKNAAEKLAQAERQRNVAKLYTQATEAYQSENWTGAIQALEELLGKSGNYRDSVHLLADAKKRNQLKELYAEAKRLYAAQKWQAVVKVFEQISIIEPTYPDSQGLLDSAQREAAELKRLADLNDLYRQGVHAMDAGQWYEARDLLERVHKAQTGFLDTERLLRKIEDEITRIEELKKRDNKINTLYEQAHGLIRSKSWRMALDKMEEIQRLDDQFVDKDGIFEKARTELEQENQATQRQNKLAAMYAESTRLLKEGKYQEALDKWQEVKAFDPKYPDRQRVQSIASRRLTELGKPIRNKPRLVITKPIWIGMIGLVALGIVVVGIVLSGRGNEQMPPTPMVTSNGNIITLPTGTPPPIGTNTTRPSTSVPTIAVSTDPTMLDDFNNPIYNGKFNTTVWGADKLVGEITQQNGLLTLILNDSYHNIGLNSTQRYQLIDLKFIEGKLMLDPASKDGTMYMGIASSGGQSICGIGTSNTKGDQGIYCTSVYFGAPQRVYTKGIIPGTWHVLRIELDSATMTFTYQLDGENIGSYTPRNPEKYKDLSFASVVHVDSGMSSTPNITGDADYVKVGKTGQ
jgi:outer membrane protein assembly factor BamD (BamD/ComL family)